MWESWPSTWQTFSTALGKRVYAGSVLHLDDMCQNVFSLTRNPATTMPTKSTSQNAKDMLKLRRVAIDNYQLTRIARLAGAPLDLNAGVDLLRKLGDEVQHGEILYRIQAEFPADFRFARNLAEQSNGFRIGTQEEISHHYLET